MIGINASLYAIDGDLSQMDENDLINYICKTYRLEPDTFRELTTTDRLRLHCQLVRNDKINKMNLGY